MGRTMIEVRCQNPACVKPHMKAQSEVTRAMKLGRGMYCSRSCSVAHANQFLGRIAEIETRECPVCGGQFEVKGTFHARTTCSEECANVLRYDLVSDDAKERQRAGSRRGNRVRQLERTAASLRSREDWKYVELKKFLGSAGIPFVFEETIGPYVVDLLLPDHHIVVEFDGRYHNGQEIAAADAKRDFYLTQHGWRVFRVPTAADQVIPGDCLIGIVAQLEERA